MCANDPSRVCQMRCVFAMKNPGTYILERAAHPKWAAHGFQELSCRAQDMTMKTYGYCRVSGDDQSLDVQREAPKAFDPGIIILEEKVSAASRDGRHKLA